MACLPPVSNFNASATSAQEKPAAAIASNDGCYTNCFFFRVKVDRGDLATLPRRGGSPFENVEDCGIFFPFR